MDKSGSLQEFLTAGLHDVYYSEKALKKCLAALSIASFTDELKRALAAPSTEVEAHVSRLELIFKFQKIKITKGKDPVADALAVKAGELIRKNEPGTIQRDVAIIYCAQLMVYHKIAAYQVLLALAQEMELQEMATLLEQCLAEDKNTAAYLTQIAGNIVNPAAQRA